MGNSLGISDRGTKAKSITSCDKAIVTNIQMFYLRESEASATNVLTARKRSVSNKCFICAKAKRQQQMFYLCESEASAKKCPAETEINPSFCLRAIPY
ncbi:hypothetical protein [Lysinibacillus sphaericus]|uniref:hypothetical protein n=1 Tax=Lysinibacillus sphaericus TaxID=1421 RepID=UPI0018CD3283|nr:hypothetical protein [Lysinibacillus sphaericus]